MKIFDKVLSSEVIFTNYNNVIKYSSFSETSGANRTNSGTGFKPVHFGSIISKLDNNFSTVCQTSPVSRISTQFASLAR